MFPYSASLLYVSDGELAGGFPKMFNIMICMQDETYLSKSDGAERLLSTFSHMGKQTPTNFPPVSLQCSRL